METRRTAPCHRRHSMCLVLPGKQRGFGNKRRRMVQIKLLRRLTGGRILGLRRTSLWSCEKIKTVQARRLQVALQQPAHEAAHRDPPPHSVVITAALVVAREGLLGVMDL